MCKLNRNSPLKWNYPSVHRPLRHLILDAIKGAPTQSNQEPSFDVFVAGYKVSAFLQCAPRNQANMRYRNLLYERTRKGGVATSIRHHSIAGKLN